MASTITPLIQDYIVDFASNNNFFFVKGVQGDGYGTRYARISLSNSGQPYEIDKDAVTVVIRGSKPDTKQIFNTCEILDESTIQFELTQQILAIEGKGHYEISVMSNTENRVLTSFPFYIITSKSSFDVGFVTSSNEFTLLVSKINAATKAINEAKEVTEETEEFLIEAQTNESIRVSAEQTRISSENERISNENLRKSSEVIRESAENNRNKAESERYLNEVDRQDAETQRVDSEITRVNAENIRVEAEKTRNHAEIVRNDAENQRLSAENQRVTKENDRLNAESIRVESEEERESSETIRQSNENIRISNENSRIEAETLRQSNTSLAISNAEKATTDANTATNSAYQAIEALKNSIGIDDANVSSISAWSSEKTSTEIENIKTQLDDHTHGNATTETAGFMSPEMVVTINDIKTACIEEITESDIELIFVEE